MLKDYESVIELVCGLDNWRHAPLKEKEGALGVAMVLAFAKGTTCSLEEFSKHLNLYRSELDLPYKRLLVNGVFSPRHEFDQDPVLLGDCDNQAWILAKDRTRNAWCHVAGIASGLTGLREKKSDIRS